MSERLPMGAGSYELLSRVGTGGMAEVFVACRRGPYAIAHTVVVKRLRDEFRCVPAIAKMFAWEAWISSRLCHPNIARFYDFVTHKGREHLVLEHVRGPDLATIWRALTTSGRVFPFRAVIDVGIAAARALEHAHGLVDDEGMPIGLVHRDVSPQNILVSMEGEIKLIDFGVAKTTSAHVPRDTAPGLVKGKMGYIAPEHLRGQPLDARGDLYALGVVLFEMLTGRRLLRRGGDVEMIRAALEAEIPSLVASRPDCPEELEVIVRRAMAQDPRDRFESAAAMERALREVNLKVIEDRDAPTLTDLSREVFTARAEGRLPDGPRSKSVAFAAPSSSKPASEPKPSEDRREDEDTKPEGALSRARSTKDPDREPVAAISAYNPDERAASTPTPALTNPFETNRTLETNPAEQPLLGDDPIEMTLRAREEIPLAPRRAPSRAWPLLLAFVMGLIAAAAMAKGGLFGVSSTPRSHHEQVGETGER